MKEAPILHSPHAINPFYKPTLEEIKKKLSLKIDETFNSYTVIDVLTKVFHRSFLDDLHTYIGNYPEEFIDCEEGWSVSRVWVNSLRIVRFESIFSQCMEDFLVDIACDTRLKIEIVRQGCARDIRRISITPFVRLRYSFNLCLCELSCLFDGVIVDEKESLYQLDPRDTRLDKNLLPVFGTEDYIRISNLWHKDFFPAALNQDVPVDVEMILRQSRKTVLEAAFQDDSIAGEYFFDHGIADIVNPETGEIETKVIKPGTILINRKIPRGSIAWRVTILHELTHHYYGRLFLILQKMHGHDYCSYLCKRRQDEGDYSSPITKMEIQANILPRYILIPEISGRKHAEKLLESYGGKRNLENFSRLVNDMADFYGTTKTMARSRLKDFGYTEVEGLMRYVNGNPVPSFISELERGQTYIIDEVEGIREYARNPEFRRVIDSGRYIYVPESGVFCLNDSTYVHRDYKGDYHLTSDARIHMADCCLVFKEEYPFAVRRIINGVLHKETTSGRGRRSLRYVNKDGSSPITVDGLALRQRVREEMSETAKFVKPFSELLVQYMEERKMNVIDLSIETGLSEETIKRMRRNGDMSFSIQSIVAVAIALHLPEPASDYFVEASPSKFLNTEEMYIYRYLMHHYYHEPVSHVNRLCVEAGVQPLTSIVEGFDDKGVKMKAV